MTKMSPLLQSAVEELKDNLSEMVEDAAVQIHKVQERMEDLQKQIVAEQAVVSGKVEDMVKVAQEWDELPEDISDDVKAALIYYIQTVEMAESHFKGTVLQDFMERWKVESQDDTIVESVQAAMNVFQNDLRDLAAKQQQIAVEMQFNNPMPFPPGTPMLRAVAVPPEAGETEWQVAIVPFMVDDNLDFQTDDLPFEFYVGAYVKGEGMSDDFNMSANVTRLTTKGEPVVFSFEGDATMGDKMLFVVGHVEQNGKPVSPIAAPPSLLKNQGPSLEQPQEQPGPKGPRLLN